VSEHPVYFALAPDALARALCAGSIRVADATSEAAARAALPALVAEHGLGFVASARARGDELVAPLEVVAEQTDGSVRARLRAVAARLGVPLGFPDAVMRETEALLADPGIDDPRLLDLTTLPFVTIDAPTSRDLDQALHLSREGDGFLFRYAIADAAHYVRAGSALFEECLLRGASFYLPGQSLPMLPRPLSEGIVSLNPEVVRRALVFAIHLDAAGAVRRTELVHARVRSAAKLSFEEVQAFLDGARRGEKGGAIAAAPYAEMLRLLPVIGRLRQADAALRQVVRYRRTELDVKVAGTGLSFIVLEGIRHDVERWNEQLSLLCNAEGGAFLRDANLPEIQPIYRVHPAPDPDRVHALEAMIAALVELLGLPASWRWRADGTTAGLSEYLESLPSFPAGGRLGRLAAAIQRQAILVNVRSSYSTEPGLHHGVGVEPYARFSAPMRELVGVFVHKEALEKLEGRGMIDLELRARVVTAANRARDVQRRLNDAANRMVLDQIFGEDLAKPLAARALHVGTVVGIAPGKVHVLLDEPTIDVKLYMGDVGKGLGGFLVPSHDGAALSLDGKRVLTLGDEVRLRVEGRDATRDRWVLVPRRS
jgi:ribonuclease R